MTTQRWSLDVKNPLGGVLLKFEWCDGALTALFVAERVKASADRWLAEGLDEWVGPSTGAGAPRHTPKESGTFLQRLGEYLQRQFGFESDLRVVEVGVSSAAPTPVVSLGVASARVAKPALRFSRTEASAWSVVSRSKVGLTNACVR